MPIVYVVGPAALFATVALPEVTLFLCYQDFCRSICINLCNYVQPIWELLVAVGCLGPGQKGEEKQIIIDIGEMILQCDMSCWGSPSDNHVIAWEMVKKLRCQVSLFHVYRIVKRYIFPDWPHILAVDFDPWSRNIYKSRSLKFWSLNLTQ